MKLGDVVKLNKSSLVNIEDKQSYKISGVQNYGQGIVIRRKVLGSELNMKKYQTISKNQLMWCKVDTKNGAFGLTHDEHIGSLASTNMALADIDTKRINPEFLEVLFRQKAFADYITKYSSGTTNRKYLTPKQLFEKVELPDLNLHEQINFIEKLKKIEIVGLESEIQTQKQLLSQLKQSILQEAIQGKLTADWREQNPNTESASELLKRIKAEKDKLIKEKKIKKEKPLPPITKEEIPFELPDGWVWCRIQDISTLKSGNSYKYAQGSVDDIPYVKVGDMNIPGNFNDVINSSNYFVYQDSMQKDLINPKSIIFPKRGGAIATNKRCNVLSKKILIDSNSMAIIPSKYIDFEFFSWWFKTIDLSTFGNEAVVPQVNNKDILPIPFPLAPFNEQNPIVVKVEALMQKCQALEDEIKTSEANAQMLMQAVLKEAFEGEKEVVEV
jgi:restriction endonuclease S subunit